ncbi:MAG: DUF72 domain-containing protein [Actinobacteria bacterium]|nr:DUF72 domain-containing protein [Actinomycetota bacterium]
MPNPRGRTDRIGCSGWNYDSWRHGVFYPERCPARLWLEYYARHFDTVEVNATFYRLPTVKAVEGWVNQTPADFVFTLKMSRYVTHVKRLRDLGPSMALYYSRIEPLVGSSKLGPVLWQLPPTFKRDDARLAEALRQLPPGRHAFEFRHPSWFAPEVMSLLSAQGAALVIGDRPEVHSFQTHELPADWTFVRFHSGTRGRRGNYSESELREWADRIRSWPVSDAFVYFNNDWEGFAPANAMRLRELLA